ncbi:hypothetical protein [Streptomyces sp. ID01-15D]|uniref:hypothetical protein n=1 Tax=Streptomyces sp. ID01-15D TaxID=462918 RepID=UPI0039F581DE
MARGTAITQHALDLGWQPPRKADAATVAAAARAGEAAATAAFARAARALAAGTAATAALIEVDIAVAAGGIAQSGEVFSELLARHFGATRRCRSSGSYAPCPPNWGPTPGWSAPRCWRRRGSHPLRPRMAPCRWCRRTWLVRSGRGDAAQERQPDLTFRIVAICVHQTPLRQPSMYWMAPST